MPTRRSRRQARTVGAVLAALLLVGCTSAATTVPTTDPSASSASATTLGDPPTGVTPVNSIQATTPATPDCSPCYGAPRSTGTLPVGVAPEASGLAPSSTDPDLFFVVDDGTGSAVVTSIHLDGSLAAEIEVAGMSTDNAEAIAPGVCGPDMAGRCLYVGDIGAEPGRSTVTIYRLPEPDAAALPTSVPSDIWTYDYPDGKYNAESLLVADDGSLVLITRPPADAGPHRVYRGTAGGGTLTLVSTFDPPRSRTPAQSIFVGNVITDASRTPEQVLLLTYDQAIEYTAPTAGADPAMFTDWPSRQLEIPRQWQSEGITYRSAAGLNSCGYVVVSEKAAADSATIGTVDCA